MWYLLYPTPLSLACGGKATKFREPGLRPQTPPKVGLRPPGGVRISTRGWVRISTRGWVRICTGDCQNTPSSGRGSARRAPPKAAPLVLVLFFTILVLFLCILVLFWVILGLFWGHPGGLFGPGGLFVLPFWLSVAGKTRALCRLRRVKKREERQRKTWPAYHCASEAWV